MKYLNFDGCFSLGGLSYFRCQLKKGSCGASSPTTYHSVSSLWISPIDKSERTDSCFLHGPVEDTLQYVAHTLITCKQSSYRDEKVEKSWESWNDGGFLCTRLNQLDDWGEQPQHGLDAKKTTFSIRLAELRLTEKLKARWLCRLAVIDLDTPQLCYRFWERLFLHWGGK